MSLRKIAKRQQEKAYVRLHGPPVLFLRGGLGMGRLRPGHRLYQPSDIPHGYTQVLGYARYDGGV